MYPYQFAYLEKDDIVDLPLPNIGTYRIVIGRNPGDQPNRADSHHWQIAVPKRTNSQLSRRSLLLTIGSTGKLIAKNISFSNIHVLTFASAGKEVILRPNDQFQIQERLFNNLSFKLNGSFILRTQGVAGGTDITTHITSFVRNF